MEFFKEGKIETQIRRSPTSKNSNSLENPLKKSLSQELWNVDWSRFENGIALKGDFVLTKISFQETLSFFQKNSKKIQRSDNSENPYYKEGFLPYKQKYFEYLGDCFGFYKNGNLIGVSLCAPTEWCTYYIYYISILPKFRGSELTLQWLEQLEKTLRPTILSKLEADISPNNVHNVQRVSKFGFLNCGVKITERFGTLIRFVKYLKDDQEELFQRNFCLDIKGHAKKSSLQH